MPYTDIVKKQAYQRKVTFLKRIERVPVLKARIQELESKLKQKGVMGIPVTEQNQGNVANSKDMWADRKPRTINVPACLSPEAIKKDEEILNKLHNKQL